MNGPERPRIQPNNAPEETARMIIDIHGHYTTAPKALENWRNAQIAGIADPVQMPRRPPT